MPSQSNHLANYLTHCRYEKCLREKTLQAYRIDLTQFDSFLSPASHALDIAHVDRQVLRAYLQHLQQSYKPKSVKRKVASLKAFFNYLELEDVIQVSPFRKLQIRIKEPFVLPTVLTFNEIRRILKAGYRAISASARDVMRQKLVIRNVAILELLFATGVRVSELCTLASQDVNLDAGYIKVHGKGQKERVVQICSDEIISLLKICKYRYKVSTEGYFFLNKHGRRLSEQSVRALIREFACNARLRHVTPHVFRHTFATLLLEQGVDIKYIQHLLGHSSIMTTQIYTHVSKQKQRQILLRKHPRTLIQHSMPAAEYKAP